jgi:DNA-binding NarL/FixJ family response regulator
MDFGTDSTSGAKERARIVIADDESLVLDAVARLLQTEFDVVGCAENGRELLSMVEELAPSAVITDVAMPEINGIEAAKLITKKYPHIPVVILSGYSDDGLIETAFEAGASGYVVKLRIFTDLIPRIQDVLAGRLAVP